MPGYLFTEVVGLVECGRYIHAKKSLWYNHFHPTTAEWGACVLLVVCFVVPPSHPGTSWCAPMLWSSLLKQGNKFWRVPYRWNYAPVVWINTVGEWRWHLFLLWLQRHSFSDVWDFVSCSTYTTCETNKQNHQGEDGNQCNKPDFLVNRQIWVATAHSLICWRKSSCIWKWKNIWWKVAQKHHQALWGTFLSPPVLMHGGLLCVAFCPSVCLSVLKY